MVVDMRKVYDSFVSGGRDSVTAATVAYDEARQQGVECRVVYINELKAFEVPEGLLPHNPLEYVRRFAE
jgi:NH3-dependent NAD+ synthetase